MVTPTKILLTGFEPFGQLKENPSQIVAEALTTLKWDDAEVRSLILPVDFIAAKGAITELYEQEWIPDIVLHLGVAKNRETITLERFAVNMMDTQNGDNAGFFPDEEPVIDGAPLAYRTTIPSKRIVEYLKNKGSNAKISNSAGTYVCNAILFISLHLFSCTEVKCGFIHLPLFETIEKNEQITTIKNIIQWLVRNQ